SWHKAIFMNACFPTAAKDNAGDVAIVRSNEESSDPSTPPCCSAGADCGAHRYSPGPHMPAFRRGVEPRRNRAAHQDNNEARACGAACRLLHESIGGAVRRP